MWEFNRHTDEPDQVTFRNSAECPVLKSVIKSLNKSSSEVSEAIKELEHAKQKEECLVSHRNSLSVDDIRREVNLLKDKMQTLEQLVIEHTNFHPAGNQKPRADSSYYSWTPKDSEMDEGFRASTDIEDLKESTKEPWRNPLSPSEGMATATVNNTTIAGMPVTSETRGSMKRFVQPESNGKEATDRKEIASNSHEGATADVSSAVTRMRVTTVTTRTMKRSDEEKTQSGIYDTTDCEPSNTEFINIHPSSSC